MRVFAFTMYTLWLTAYLMFIRSLCFLLPCTVYTVQWNAILISFFWPFFSSPDEQTYKCIHNGQTWHARVLDSTIDITLINFIISLSVQWTVSESMCTYICVWIVMYMYSRIWFFHFSSPFLLKHFDIVFFSNLIKFEEKKNPFGILSSCSMDSINWDCLNWFSEIISRCAISFVNQFSCCLRFI